MADTTFHSITLPNTDPARIPDMAAEFNTATSYAVRDYCTYQGILYRCTTAHTGTWNVSDFQATNLDNEFDDKLKIPPFQASAPANPRVGDLWIDNDEDSPILSIDPAPIAGSTNAVQSGGVKTLIDAVDVQKASRYLLTGDYSTSATYEKGQLVFWYPETFSTSHSYVVGESCVHNGVVYKCITAHTGAWNVAHFEAQHNASTDTLYRCIEDIKVPESWTAAHWQATNINTELNRLLESEADTDMIAENFGDSSFYAVGDYVVHKSDLFKCISAVSDTGSWDPNNWQQIKLADDVRDLNNVINYIAVYRDSVNLFNKDDITEGKTINISGGTGIADINDLIDNATYNVGNIIAVSAGKYCSNAAMTGSSAKIYAYNSNGKYVGQLDATASNDTYVYTIPATNVAFIRFRYSPIILDKNTYMFVAGETLPEIYEPYGVKYLVNGDLLDRYNELDEKIVDATSDIKAEMQAVDIRNLLYKFPNTIDDSEIQQYGFINGNTGAVVTNPSYTTFWYSGFCEIVGGKQYYWKNIYSGHLAFYDADQNYVDGFESNLPNPFMAPDNAKYIRWTAVSSTIGVARRAWFNIVNEAPDSTVVKYAFDKNTIFRAEVDNPCDYSGQEIQIFNKIICIGDSITQGTFNHNEGGTMAYETDARYSYPTYLTKVCGVETANKGIGGLSSVEWWNGHANEITSGYDCAIVNLGINDALQSVSSTDTITALTNIINKLKMENNGIKIFLATVVPAYSDGTVLYDGVNDTIRTVAASQSVYLIDLTRYSHARNDTVSEAGHLTAWGYWTLACDYIAAISYIMHQNFADFKFVQFIGTDHTYTP